VRVEYLLTYLICAAVGVGYEYVGCSRVFWETHSTTMSSFDITSSEIGSWNLHIHHTYNFQEGTYIIVLVVFQLKLSSF